MAHWRKKEPDFGEIVALLERNPGLSARELAQRLDVAPSTVTRALPSVEEAGILLSEDSRGRLWPFGRRK
jgi:DNA-binding MarR family transcriptional regulator